jgi:hypothetical protein
VSILAGDDVDPMTGRLLTVAELQAALQAALVVNAHRQAPTGGVDSSRPASPTDRPDRPDDPADDPVGGEVVFGSRWRPRWTGPWAPVIDPVAAPVPLLPADEPGRAAPAGFTGVDAAAAWTWLTTSADAPQIMVCSAPGVGVEGTRVAALLAGVMGAARTTLAVEIGRGTAASLTHLVCGSAAERVSAADWLPQDPAQAPHLRLLPDGPSGTRVVQTGTHLWGHLQPRIPAGTAVITDLGSVDHHDVRGVLISHPGPAVMIARADTAGVTAALAALTDLDAEGLPRRPLLVLADAEGARPGALRAAQRLAQTTGGGVVVVPRCRELRACPIPASGWRKDLAAAVAAILAGLAARETSSLSRPA